jgi:hypothetical protein
VKRLAGGEDATFNGLNAKIPGGGGAHIASCVMDWNCFDADPDLNPTFFLMPIRSRLLP